MRVTTIHTSTKVSILAVVLATCLVAVGASAQFGGPSTFIGKFTLPYEIQWGKAVLPAGNYSISMESPQSPAIVRSVSGKISVFVPAPIVSGSQKGDTCLTVMTRGSDHRVQSLNLPGLGKSLIYEPLTKAEYEQLAKAGQVQPVTLTMAGR